LGDLAVGVGLSVPFGSETDYQPGWVGRYSALRSKLSTGDIQPTIAYRLWNRLSVGASIDVQYASARLTEAIDFGLLGARAVGHFEEALPGLLAARGVPVSAIPGVISATQRAYSNAGFIPGGRDGASEIKASDWKAGFSIGAIFQYLGDNEVAMLQEGRFGFSYRSGITHDVQANARFRGVPIITAAGAPVQFPAPDLLQNLFFDQGASARLELPEIYHFSLFQRFARQFAIMGDINWTRWSSLQSVTIKFENPVTPSTKLDFGYQDTIRYAIGFEWYATKSLTLRLGFAYDETPITSSAFRTPRLPDNNKYVLACGLRWSPSRSLDFDVGYSHLFIKDSQLDLVDNEGHNLRGKFETASDIVGVAATFRWGGPTETVTSAPFAKPGKSLYKQ
jgi:long-chain fatty acid transport protein